MPSRLCRSMAEQYRVLVEAMYGGKTMARLDAGSGEDAEHADVKIRDAKVVAPAQSRRAA